MAYSYCTVVFATLIQIISTECANLDTQQNSLAYALRNILSPKNTEKAIQIIEMASNGQIGKPVSCIEQKLSPMVKTPIRRISPTGLTPIGVASIDGTQIGAMQRPIQSNSRPYFIPRGTPDVPIDLHKLVELLSANAIQEHNSHESKFEMPNIPFVINTSRDIVQVPTAKEVSCPCASQTSLMNPFLPAASPISAWTQLTSSLLQPASPTQSRGHFLRKIPIPPPTL